MYRTRSIEKLNGLHWSGKKTNFFRPLGIQPKLSVNSPGDSYEKEADAMADHVMRQTTSGADVQHQVNSSNTLIQRKCDKCEEEEKLQRKEKNSAPVSPKNFPGKLSSTKGGGYPLNDSTLSTMNHSFGVDFSNVRIHSGSEASTMNENIQAKAFTYGNDIYFNQNQYQPSSSEGKRLLAHELTHVVQQGKTGSNTIQRAPDEETLKKFDEVSASIKSHEVYKKLDFMSKQYVLQIIRLARSRDNAIYYITKLNELINTPDKVSTEQAGETAADMEKYAQEEADRIKDPASAAAAAVGNEEAGSLDPSRVWTTRRGEGGITFQVDARDVNNIFVKAKVRPKKRGKGTDDDVTRLISMEDAIEKYASTAGYSVDLDFVKKSGSDVFTVGVDTSEWTTSGNWVGEPMGFAHELHHLLGLDDRYDYIEAHATNEDMVMKDRIYWFRQQLDRPNDPFIDTSIMGGGFVAIDDDVCRVAGLDVTTCSTTREANRTSKYEEARMSAFTLAFQAWQNVSGIKPDMGQDPNPKAYEEHHYLRTARTLFGSDVSLATMADFLGDLRYKLLPGNATQLAPTIAGIDGKLTWVDNMKTPIYIMPQFYEAPIEDRRDSILISAMHLARISDGTDDVKCPADDCKTACGTSINNAFAWKRFIECI